MAPWLERDVLCFRSCYMLDIQELNKNRFLCRFILNLKYRIRRVALFAVVYTTLFSCIKKSVVVVLMNAFSTSWFSLKEYLKL